MSRLINSIIKSLHEYDPGLEHIILLQTKSASTSLQELFDTYSKQVKLKLSQQKTLLNINQAMNTLISQVTNQLVWKADDDCVIQSDNFFKHVEAIHNMYPKMVFSPFPVGLIENFGGARSAGRFTQYCQTTDTVYTFRKVPNIGGFARFSPLEYFSQYPENGFPLEDQCHSELMRKRGIMQCYLENALIVEHQESSLGQKERKTIS